MKRIFLLTGFLSLMLSYFSQSLPKRKKILKTMQLTNQYFMNKWHDAGKSIFTNIERPSNIWTRAVYYEGLMSLYGIDKKKTYYD